MDLALTLLLYGLYAGIIGGCYALARACRDRPTTQLLAGALALLPIYNAIRRGYTLVVDQAGVLDGLVGAILIWLAVGALLARTLVIVRRTKRGEEFTGVDGQRWGTVTTHTPTGPVQVPRPLHLLRREERERAAGD